MAKRRLPDDPEDRAKRTKIVVLGDSPAATDAALELSAGHPDALVVLVAGRKRLPAQQMSRLTAAGVITHVGDPCLEIAPDDVEGGGVVATESGAMFEYDLLVRFPGAGAG